MESPDSSTLMAKTGTVTNTGEYELLVNNYFKLYSAFTLLPYTLLPPKGATPINSIDPQQVTNSRASEDSHLAVALIVRDVQDKLSFPSPLFHRCRVPV
nr:hypothetical protein MACL_00000023 [Theileria orientalis]